MRTQRLLGCAGFARYLGVSERLVRIIDIPPDALVDGRKAWTEETAARVKAEREAKREAKRAARLNRAEAA